MRTQLLEMVESKKDSAEGAALSTLVHAVEAAWTQQPDARPGLEELHGALATAHAPTGDIRPRVRAWRSTSRPRTRPEGPNLGRS